MDNFEIGYMFKEVVYGVQSLQKGGITSEIEDEEFRRLSCVVNTLPKMNPLIQKYNKILGDKGLSVADINPKITNILIEKNLDYLENSELEAVLDSFRHL